MPVGVSCVRWVYKKEEGRKEKGWIDVQALLALVAFRSKQPRAKCDAQTSFHALNGGFKYVPRLKLES